MRTLVFGAGDLARVYSRGHDDVILLERDDCDASDYDAVVEAIEHWEPHRVLCTAGLSDIKADSLEEVLNANLVTAINVGTAAAAAGLPCVLVASTAGIVPGDHAWYGPAKAGVINFVRAMANRGARIWAISPGRIHTSMRQDDFPEEDPATRLEAWVVGVQIENIFNGDYAPGANVVIRKVGYHRTDIYEEVAPCLPSLL